MGPYVDFDERVLFDVPLGDQMYTSPRRTLIQDRDDKWFCRNHLVLGSEIFLRKVWTGEGDSTPTSAKAWGRYPGGTNLLEEYRVKLTCLLRAS